MTFEEEVWLEARKLDQYGLSDAQADNIAVGTVTERRLWRQLAESYIGVIDDEGVGMCDADQRTIDSLRARGVL